MWNELIVNFLLFIYLIIFKFLQRKIKKITPIVGKLKKSYAVFKLRGFNLSQSPLWKSLAGRELVGLNYGYIQQTNKFITNVILSNWRD